MLTAITNHLWQSTLFAAVAWLLTLALKKNRAHVRHWVWLVASVKFLVPLALLVSMGSRISWRTAGATSAIPIVVEQVAEPFTARIPAVQQETPTRVDPTPTLLWLIWGIGFVSIATRWGGKWTRIHANVRTARTVDLGLTIPVKLSATVIEPGVFGIFRPILVLPEGIADKLTPTQLQAILAHEMCHVRRRDNLVTSIHMLVEAAFWFHPLVWWIGARLIEERERACDEEVLRRGGDAQTYAQGILRVCEFYLAAPLECVAGVTGANLSRRIEEIMTKRIALKLSLGKKLLLAAAGAFAVAGPVSVGLLSPLLVSAQSRANSSAEQAAFEVASIKVNNTGPGEGGALRPSPNGLTTLNMPFKALVSWAYDVRNNFVSGPSWIDSSRYDISARAPDTILLDTKRMDALRGMLRKALAERFHLTVHRETKDLPVYGIVVGKNGPKRLSAAALGSPSMMQPGAFGSRQEQHWLLKNTSMASFAGFLSRPQLDRPVVDLTGMVGGFDFMFDYPPRDPNVAPLDYLLNEVFPAVDDQLGLRVESRKAPMEVLVIDRAESVPTEN